MKDSKSINTFFENISKLTRVQRILIFFGTLFLILFLFVYFLYLPKYKKIKQYNKDYQEVDLKIQKAKAKANTLAKLKKEWEKAQLEFSVVMGALPEKKEIPTLLTNISQSGNSSGLQFITFKPSKEVVKDFYAEIPIDISVLGGYHNLGVFLDQIARLNRIVNIRNLNIKTDAKVTDKVVTSFQAVTYKFIEPKNNTNTKKKK